ncbi:MAG: hypothetical protein ABEJ73_10865 [Haloplanus sp.]
MSLAARLGGLVGTLLLAVGALAALWGVGLVGWTLWAGPTATRVLTAMVAFGFALGAGLTGAVLRKHAAGTLLPVDVDISVAFRGGQGGL